MNLLKYWLRCLICWNHSYKWVINFYGDAIIAHNGKRSRWECVKCGWPQFRDELYDKSAGKHFRIQEPTGPF